MRKRVGIRAEHGPSVPPPQFMVSPAYMLKGFQGLL